MNGVFYLPDLLKTGNLKGNSSVSPREALNMLDLKLMKSPGAFFICRRNLLLIFFMTVSLITDARYFTIIPHGDTCASGKEYVKENLPDTGSFRRN